jgi:hypothetical protein
MEILNLSGDVFRTLSFKCRAVYELCFVLYNHCWKYTSFLASFFCGVHYKLKIMEELVDFILVIQ